MDGVSSYLSAALQTLHIIPKFRHELASVTNATSLPATSLAHSIGMVFNNMEQGKGVSQELVKEILDKLAAKNPELKNGAALNILHPLRVIEMIIADIEGEVNAKVPHIADSLGEIFKVKTVKGDFMGLELKDMFDVDVKNPASEIRFEDLMDLAFATSVNKKYVFHFGLPKKLLELPPYLVVKLPRFDKTGKRIQNTMSFPLTTNFREYIVNPTASMYNYELIGIGFHNNGDAVDKGHYKVLTKQSDTWWYAIDDLRVNLLGVKPGKIFDSKEAAYVIYRARSEFPFQHVDVLPPFRNGINNPAPPATVVVPPVINPIPPTTIVVPPVMNPAPPTTVVVPPVTKTAPLVPKPITHAPRTSYSSGGSSSGGSSSGGSGRGSGGSKKTETSPAPTTASQAPSQDLKKMSSEATTNSTCKMIVAVLSSVLLML